MTWAPLFRSPGAAEEYDALAAAGAAAQAFSDEAGGLEVDRAGVRFAAKDPESHWVRVTAVDGSAPPRHSFEEVAFDAGSGDWVAVAGLKSGPTTNADWAYRSDLGSAAVDDVVLVRKCRHGYWVFTAGAQGGGKIKGVLDGALASGGSATMSVWRYVSGSESDTGVNVTVYDWFQQTISSGLRTTAFYEPSSGRWLVDGAACEAS